MNITSDLIGFPFKDERWKQKFAIGALVGLIGIVFFPVFFLFYGYGIRVMRQTLRDEEPTLPEWDNFGELVMDSLRFVAVSFVYFLPVTLVLCIGLAVMIPVMIAAPISAAAADSPQAAFGSAGFSLAASLLFSLVIGVISLLSIPLILVAYVGLTRAIAHDRLSAAFEIGKVWQVFKAGMGSFIIAFLLWYAITLGLGMVASFLIYTVILCIVYPIVLGAIQAYSMVLLGALFGRAYHEAMQKLDAPVEVKPAEAAPALPAEAVAAEKPAPKPRARKAADATMIEVEAAKKEPDEQPAKKPRTRKPKAEAKGDTDAEPENKPRTRRKKSTDTDSEGA